MAEGLEEELYGKWIEADAGATVAITTVNPVVALVEADAFVAEAVMLVDENTTVIKLRHIETKSLFEVTWVYQEEEKKNGE